MEQNVGQARCRSSRPKGIVAGILGRSSGGYVSAGNERQLNVGVVLGAAKETDGRRRGQDWGLGCALVCSGDGQSESVAGLNHVGGRVEAESELNRLGR